MASPAASFSANKEDWRAVVKESTVGDLVAKEPNLARIFEEYSIDYCCGGGVTLADACTKQDVPIGDIVDSIEKVRAKKEAGTQDEQESFVDMTLTDLTGHIVSTHHAFMAEELPRISTLVAKVHKVHGERHPELSGVAMTFESLRTELEAHMGKEERVLFPAICRMENDANPIQFPFGSVDNPIGCLEHEHDDAGRVLQSLRDLTDNYTPPEDACRSYRSMLESLRDLERDLHVHIHKENSILFPRAKELESEWNAQ